MDHVVGFAGRIGSGKTTLSRMTAQRLELQWTSFGDLVRRTASEQRLEQTRQSLQDLGDSMIAAGWKGFCGSLLALADWRHGQGLVIDGIRHVAAVTTLRDLVDPNRLLVVFVDLPPEMRRSRLESRGITPGAIAAADAHPNEAEVDAVRAMADIVVDNSGLPKDTLDEIVRRFVD